VGESVIGRAAIERILPPLGSEDGDGRSVPLQALELRPATSQSGSTVVGPQRTGLLHGPAAGRRGQTRRRWAVIHQRLLRHPEFVGAQLSRVRNARVAETSHLLLARFSGGTARQLRCAGGSWAACCFCRGRIRSSGSYRIRVVGLEPCGTSLTQAGPYDYLSTHQGTASLWKGQLCWRRARCLMADSW
jgi:hypothetical protein